MCKTDSTQCYTNTISLQLLVYIHSTTNKSINQIETKMAFSTFHQIHFLILVALSLIFLNHNNNVKADEGLIHDTCHSTEVPELCEQCLDSIPGSKDADVIGLATNIVQCVSVHAKFLQSNMSEWGSRIGIQKELKAALKNCSEGYSKAMKKNLFNVGTTLKQGNFDGANKLISMAVYIQLECRQNLDSYEWDPEPNIIYDMNSYDDLCLGAMRIIDRI